MTGRALFLTSNFPRWLGDSTTPFVLHLAQDLGAEGWEVDVLAPHAPGAARRESLGGVDVHRFRYALPESAESVCYGGGALVNIRHRPLERMKLPLLVASEWAAAARVMRRRHYDVVNAHWMLPQGLVATTLPARPPVVVTIHGGDVYGLRGRGMRTFKRHALQRATAVTVNSTTTRRAVHEIADDLDIRTIPMGAEVTVPDRRRMESIRAENGRGGPLLVFVGRLVEEKGVGDLVRAVAMLLPRYPGIRLMVVGDGQDRERFVQEAARSAGDAIRFVGWVDPAEVGSYLAAADVFVAPSRTGVDGWTEGQGLTVVESMFAGTPVVSTRSGGIVDSIANERSGLLVDEGAPQQLASAISRVIDDPQLGRRLAEAARADAEARFTRSSSAAGFARLFEEVAR